MTELVADSVGESSSAELTRQRAITERLLLAALRAYSPQLCAIRIHQRIRLVMVAKYAWDAQLVISCWLDAPGMAMPDAGIAPMPAVQVSIMRDHMRGRSSGFQAMFALAPSPRSPRCMKPSSAHEYARCHSCAALVQYCSQSVCWKCLPFSSSFMSAPVNLAAMRSTPATCAADRASPT